MSFICRYDDEADERRWIAAFESVLGQMRVGDIGAARASLQRTRELRGGTDGPAQFYLETIGQLEREGRLAGWTGVVEMAEK